FPTYRSVFAQCSSYPQGFSTRVTFWLTRGSILLTVLLSARRAQPHAAERCQQLAFDLIYGRQTQDSPRQDTHLSRVDLREHLAVYGNRSRRNADLGQAQPHEQRQRGGIGRLSAAERPRDAPRRGRPPHHQDHAEDGRMERLIKPRYSL